MKSFERVFNVMHIVKRGVGHYKVKRFVWERKGFHRSPDPIEAATLLQIVVSGSQAVLAT